MNVNVNVVDIWDHFIQTTEILVYVLLLIKENLLLVVVQPVFSLLEYVLQRFIHPMIHMDLIYVVSSNLFNEFLFFLTIIHVILIQ